MKKILLASAIAAVSSTSAFALDSHVGVFTTAANAINSVANSNFGADPSYAVDIADLSAAVAQHGDVEFITYSEAVHDTNGDLIGYTDTIVEYFDRTADIQNGILDFKNDVRTDFFGATDNTAWNTNAQVANTHFDVTSTTANSGFVGVAVNGVVAQVNILNTKLPGYDATATAEADGSFAVASNTEITPTEITALQTETDKLEGLAATLNTNWGATVSAVSKVDALTIQPATDDLVTSYTAD